MQKAVHSMLLVARLFKKIFSIELEASFSFLRVTFARTSPKTVNSMTFFHITIVSFNLIFSSIYVLVSQVT